MFACAHDSQHSRRVQIAVTAEHTQRATVVRRLDPVHKLGSNSLGSSSCELTHYDESRLIGSPRPVGARKSGATESAGGILKRRRSQASQQRQ